MSDVILSYLEANPNAGDTLDGVVMWWLGPNRSRVSRSEVSEALESLVEQGRIQKSAPAGGETIYSLKTARSKR